MSVSIARVILTRLASQRTVNVDDETQRPEFGGERRFFVFEGFIERRSRAC